MYHAEWTAWAAYRLGMYSHVGTLTSRRPGWRYILAKAVSFAARLQYSQAETYIELLMGAKLGVRQRAVVAMALAPYMPRAALRAAPAERMSTSWLVALNVKAGRVEEAQYLMSKAVEEQSWRDDPELHLHYSNLLADSAGEKLTQLNAFLTNVGVPGIQVRRAVDPIRPENLCGSSVSPVAGPLVSVLMTAYRSGKRIGSAVESLLGQSYTNIELIIVDDASDDNTRQVVASFAQADRRVKLLSLPVNGGTYVAKNIALRYARGEYITCHDSDDWSHPLKLERQIAPLIANRRLVATVSDWIRVSDDGQYFARLVHPLTRINLSSLLFRRDALGKVGAAWDCVRTGADSELLARLRLVFGPDAVHRIRQPLAVGSHRPDSLMTGENTGYSDDAGTNSRLAYWEAWSQWHIDCLRQGRIPVLSNDIVEPHNARSFPVPGSIVVDSDRIKACLDGCIVS